MAPGNCSDAMSALIARALDRVRRVGLSRNKNFVWRSLVVCKLVRRRALPHLRCVDACCSLRYDAESTRTPLLIEKHPQRIGFRSVSPASHCRRRVLARPFPLVCDGEKVDPSGIPFGHVAGHHSALSPRCLTSEGKMSPKSERYRCAGVQ